MNNIYKVSILVPVYGVEKYIVQCAESLFNQDYDNIEFIFVNDCTKDKSIDRLLDVLSRFSYRKKQVKIITHQENKGLAAARNTALENSTGDYLLPIDSDDFLSSSDAVSKLINEATYYNADIVFYDLQFFPERKSMDFDVPLDSKLLTKKIIERDTLLSLCGGLYRKAIFIENNIRSFEHISMGEDYAIKPMLSYCSRTIRHVSIPFYCYRQDNDNSITKTFKLKHIEDLKQCVQGFYEFFLSQNDYNEYKESLLISELKCKIQSLKWWCINNGNSDDLKRINFLFPHRPNYIKYLSKNDALLYFISKFNNSQLIHFLYKVKCYFIN